MKQTRANGTAYGGIDNASAYRNPITLNAQITPKIKNTNIINIISKIYFKNKD